MPGLHTNLWEQYQRAAKQASEHGNLAKAARILKDGLRETEEYREISQPLIEEAHDLAERYLKQARFSEAESLYRLVLEVREKLLGPTHDDVIDSLKKVALIQILAFRAEALGSKVFNVQLTWSTDIVQAVS